MSYDKHGHKSGCVNILFLKSTGMILVIYFRVVDMKNCGLICDSLKATNIK